MRSNDKTDIPCRLDRRSFLCIIIFDGPLEIEVAIAMFEAASCLSIYWVCTGAKPGQRKKEIRKLGIGNNAFHPICKDKEIILIYEMDITICSKFKLALNKNIFKKGMSKQTYNIGYW